VAIEQQQFALFSVCRRRARPGIAGWFIGIFFTHVSQSTRWFRLQQATRKILP
jgi:hypothetical protein